MSVFLLFNDINRAKCRQIVWVPRSLPSYCVCNVSARGNIMKHYNRNVNQKCSLPRNHILPQSISFLLLQINIIEIILFLQALTLISYFSGEKHTEAGKGFQKCWLQLLDIWNVLGQHFNTRRGGFFTLFVYLTLCSRIFYSSSLFEKWPFRLNPNCRSFFFLFQGISSFIALPSDGLQH